MYITDGLRWEMMTKAKMRDNVELRIKETEGSIRFSINKQTRTKTK